MKVGKQEKGGGLEERERRLGEGRLKVQIGESSEFSGYEKVEERRSWSHSGQSL